MGGARQAASELGSIRSQGFDEEAYWERVQQRADEWGAGARDQVKTSVMSRMFNIDVKGEFRDPSMGKSNVAPIEHTISDLGYRPWQFQQHSTWP